MRILMCAIAIGSACLMAGCGEEGKWVDFPMATCENIPQFESNENAQFMARGVCSNAGGSYSGRTRCANNAVQIQCK